MTNINMAELIADSEHYLMHTYNRFPVAFVDGHEATLIDSDGKEYLDFLAGISVVNLGYSNQNIKAAMTKQLETMIHTSNYFQIPSQTALAKALCENSFADKAFFCNSGAEANEAAVKIARKRAYQKYGSHKNEIIAVSGAFHGRTLMTLNITDNESYREGYGPHPLGFKFTPFNDVTALAASVNENTAGVILEPIQGEGGVYPASQAFLTAARALTEKYDCALIFDEVQSGMGRTGKLFAHEHYEVTPDIVSMAKGLANGIPIGAVLANAEYGKVLTPGSHGTTFGGNPLATAAALATVTEMLTTDILQQTKARGQYMLAKLATLQQSLPAIVSVRGLGLMIGLELNFNGSEIVAEMLGEGFVINCTQGNVLRFLPPFVITEAEIDKMIATLKQVIISKLAVQN